MLVHRDWLLTVHRAAVHLPTATAVIADLHLGYGRSRRRGGEAVPDDSLDETIAALGPVVARRDVRSLLLAGDLVEDRSGLPLVPELTAWLRSMGVAVAIVPGNHDRALSGEVLDVPFYPEGIVLGEWLVVHGDGTPSGRRLIQGHHHPWLRWRGRVSAPCYLVGKGRLVLPAFSADAAGVNVVGNPRWRRYRCCVLGSERVLDFGPLARLRSARVPRGG